MYNNLWLINPVVAIFRWSPCGRENIHYVIPLNGEEICESQNVQVSVSHALRDLECACNLCTQPIFLQNLCTADC